MMERKAVIRKLFRAIVMMALFAFVAPAWRAQTPVVARPPAVAFEVAAMRLSDPKGNGMTSVQWAGTDRFIATNTPLEFLVELAYGVQGYQIEGLPAWSGDTMYDITAKVEGDAHLTYDQLKPLLQELLAERLHLVVQASTKQMKGYVLLVAKGGPKLKESKVAPVQAYILPSGLRADGLSMDGFAEMLTHPIGRPVRNDTGLAGSYALKLDYAPNESADSTLPSIFTALVEQLGLKVEPQMVPVAMVRLNRVERLPTAN